MLLPNEKQKWKWRKKTQQNERQIAISFGYNNKINRNQKCEKAQIVCWAPMKMVATMRMRLLSVELMSACKLYARSSVIITKQVFVKIWRKKADMYIPDISIFWYFQTEMTKKSVQMKSTSKTLKHVLNVNKAWPFVYFTTSELRWFYIVYCTE